MNGDMVIVIVNLSQQGIHCHLGADKIMDVYTTSVSSNMEKSRQNTDNFEVPARAVSTCILK
jgi:hypothetical protein